MADPGGSFGRLRRNHPVYFWGMSILAAALLFLTAAAGYRIPEYRRELAAMDAMLGAAERTTRDGILNAQTRRAWLSFALLRRELRLRSLHEKQIHLAIDNDSSTISLRHGATVLRSIPFVAGADSIVRAPDGRQYRFVRALGERTLERKQENATVVIPEWVYHSRGLPVPSTDARTIRGGGGKYLLILDDGTEIYSRPARGPLVEGVKPGAFMATERDLEAIFEAVDVDTPVYIY